MDFMQQYSKELEKELNQFLFLCGKDDEKILLTAATLNNLKEHVRLACIAIVFGYKKLLLKMFAHCEKYFNEFKARLDDVSRNFSIIDGWVIRFTDNIKHPEAQKITRAFWAEQKTNLAPNNFNIRQLLK